jgi:pimeloyl-ACP methyl ester carboxylesterase
VRRGGARGRTLACALATSAWLSVAAVAGAQAARAGVLTWGACRESNNIACGHMAVPLNPADPAQGTITLTLRRHRAPLGEARDAVIALAGGPGQSAIPFLGQFGALLGPIVDTRDLIAFDQRGTGFSHPLSCAAFEHARNGSPRAVALCGSEIGRQSDLFTTAQTVADIEAIRQAGGYEKLVLYGTSYGTKVAERYAQTYPSRVEALVLDSVVPPSGPEAFDRSTFAAVPRVLRQLCSARACARITADPVRDLARLVKRLGARGVRGQLIDGDGRPRPEHVSSDDLVETLLAGDFNPLLRAEFPAAARSAVRGDYAELARLVSHAEGGEGEEGEEEPAEGFDVPLYYATICDEVAFPWNPAANPVKRLREARAALRAIGSSAFAPFTAANALALSDVPACAGWPAPPGGPEVDGVPLPDVPALILSGADDLRTPTSGARQVAAQIPDASLLVVPNTGHSVLGSDPTPCAHDALKAFFEQRPIGQCKDRATPPLLLPTPLPPRSLREVPPARGNHGLPGRTLQAVGLTLGDFARQLFFAVIQHIGQVLFGSGSVRTGGLRAGWGGLVHGKIELRGYSYVPGVTVSGAISGSGARLRVGGGAAAHGTLRIERGGGVSGVLGGVPVHVSPRRRAGGGLGLAASAPARVSSLVAHPKRLAALRDDGIAALLRDVFGG